MWKVIPHKSSSVAHSSYSKLLYAVATVLPQGVEVLFLADRGFADIALLKQLRRLKWHYRIRIKSSFYLYLGKRGRAISSYQLRPGEALFFHAVALRSERYGEVDVALGVERKSKERWIIVSDQPSSAETFREYSWRFDIEEGFKGRQVEWLSTGKLTPSLCPNAVSFVLGLSCSDALLEFFWYGCCRVWGASLD